MNENFTVVDDDEIEDNQGNKIELQEQTYHIVGNAFNKLTSFEKIISFDAFFNHFCDRTLPLNTCWVAGLGLLKFQRAILQKLKTKLPSGEMLIGNEAQIIEMVPEPNVLLGDFQKMDEEQYLANLILQRSKVKHFHLGLDILDKACDLMHYHLIEHERNLFQNATHLVTKTKCTNVYHHLFPLAVRVETLLDSITQRSHGGFLLKTKTRFYQGNHCAVEIELVQEVMELQYYEAQVEKQVQRF